VVGSSDSSLSAGQNLTLQANGLATQGVQASNGQGVSLATLASRAAGISDPNLPVPGDTADGLTAGQNLTLGAKAQATNTVTSQATTIDRIGSFTLVDGGAAANDYLQSSQLGDQFPLINGDRIRFSTASGGVLANHDYYVFNRNVNTGTFQISEYPGGEPVAISANGALAAYRPADALADGLASSIAVQLSRSGVGSEALQAGAGLGVTAAASQVLTLQSTSVAGAASAGLNRMGGLEGMDAATRSLVVALQDTGASAAGPASLNLSASLLGRLEATSVAGPAQSEANGAVVASDSSRTVAGQALAIGATASNNLSSSAKSTAGSAQARSGAGAGAGLDLAVDGAPDAVSAQAGSYGNTSGLVNASQQAGGSLTIAAAASSQQRAVASAVGGDQTLPSASSSSAGYVVFNNNQLADGDPIQVSAAGASGLSTTTPYRVGTLGFTVDPVSNQLTSTSGISYAAGDVVHFRLNSTTALNDGNNPTGRSGLTFGTPYYVLVGGTSFQVATAAGGAPVTLSADTVGSADTLLDADRIRLLEAVSSGQAYIPVALTDSTANITLVLPSVALALAGGRDGDTVLNQATADNSAVVTGIDGLADAALTIRSLTAGQQATVAGIASGLVQALATNTASDALASGAQVAQGIKDVAITAGSDGSLTAKATVAATADAATVGAPNQGADALANLTLTATGLSQTVASQAIDLGGQGQIQAEAGLSGSSTATTVTGNSDALADLVTEGLRLDAGNTITIGQQGNINAVANLGSALTPFLVSSQVAGAGNATSQVGQGATGLLGSSTAPGLFSTLELGGGDTGVIKGTAQANLEVRASATSGNSSASLLDPQGGSTADINGMQNIAVDIAASLSKINGIASGQALLQALSVGGDSTSTAATTTSGILSNTGSGQPFHLSQNAEIAALANQRSLSSAVSVLGQATSELSNSSIGLKNLNLTVGGTSQVRAEALSDLLSRAQTSSGDANA